MFQEPFEELKQLWEEFYSLFPLHCNKHEHYEKWISKSDHDIILYKKKGKNRKVSGSCIPENVSVIFQKQLGTFNDYVPTVWYIFCATTLLRVGN